VASVLLLDGEAVNALANARDRSVSARRAQALLDEAQRRGALVRIPAAVLVEVYRGGRADAKVDRVVGRGNRIVALDHATGRVAGRLRARDDLDSCHTVDATVVATAIRLGGGVIATADPDDLKRLARDNPNVAIHALT